MYFVYLEYKKSATVFDNSTKSYRNSVDPVVGRILLLLLRLLMRLMLLQLPF